MSGGASRDECPAAVADIRVDEPDRIEPSKLWARQHLLEWKPRKAATLIENRPVVIVVWMTEVDVADRPQT